MSNQKRIIVSREAKHSDNGTLQAWARSFDVSLRDSMTFKNIYESARKGIT